MTTEEEELCSSAVKSTPKRTAAAGFSSLALRERDDGGLDDRDPEEQHSEAEDDGPDVFDGAVFYKQLDHRAGEEDQGGVGAQVESCDLGGDGGTDVGAHDHADGLGQRHQTGVDKADDHHVRGGGTLDQKGHQDPDDHRDKAVRGGALQNGAKLIAGGQLETGGHHTHSVQKQAYTAKQRKKFEYSHKKDPYSFFKDCWYRSTAL